jgi:hypothetical protein
MTHTEVPDLPIPTDAVPGDWTCLTGHAEDWIRTMTWSRHDAAGAVVAVQGAQYADGRIERYIYFDDVPDELTAAGARQLAAALLDAADAADAFDGMQ